MLLDKHKRSDLSTAIPQSPAVNDEEEAIFGFAFSPSVSCIVDREHRHTGLAKAGMNASNSDLLLCKHGQRIPGDAKPNPALGPRERGQAESTETTTQRSDAEKLRPLLRLKQLHHAAVVTKTLLLFLQARIAAAGVRRVWCLGELQVREPVWRRSVRATVTTGWC